MAKHDGNDIAFIFGAFTFPAGSLVSVDFPRMRGEYEATGATQDDQEYFPGKRSSTVTVNAWDDVADTIRAACENTTAEATGQYFPQGNTTGKPKRSASMFVTNISDPGNHDAMTPITITFRVNGAVTASTVA